MSDSPPPLASPCPNCKKKGGSYAKLCIDFPDDCRMRAVFPLPDDSYKNARSFYGASSLAYHLEAIEDEEQRLKAAESMVHVAKLFNEDPVYGPFGRLNEHHLRTQTLDNLCRLLGRTIIILARGYDFLVRCVPTQLGVVAPSAENVANNILHSNHVDIPNVSVPFNEVEHNFRALLEYIQNMQYPPALHRSRTVPQPSCPPYHLSYPHYQSETEPKAPGTEPTPPHQRPPPPN